MIHPWVFEFFHALPSDSAAGADDVRRHFDQHLDLWTQDEALGFEGIFFSEHHFGPAYSPSPNLLVAAMASRTSAMRLGTLGGSTAYATPLRIIEEAAMLDNLTNGRLEIGIVRGIPPELARLGISTADADTLFDETLRAVNEAFEGAKLGSFACGDLPVVPPLRQVDPPKWLAITSEKSARRAASLGWKACAGFLSCTELKKTFDAYRDERLGGDSVLSRDMLGVRRRVLFVESQDQVAEARLHLREQAIAHAKAGFEKGPDEGSAAAKPSQPIIDLDTMLQRMLSEDEFIVGTPDDVAEEIIRQCSTIGCAHFFAGLDSTPIFAEMAAAHEIFGKQVIPKLRKAKLPDITELAA